MSAPVPDPTAVVVSRFAKEVATKALSRAADAVVNLGSWLIKTFFTGSIVVALVILACLLIVLQLVLPHLGLSVSTRHGVIETAGAVAALLLLLKVFAVMLLPSSRR